LPHIDTRKEITLRDKAVALVTEANQGIGLQIAKDLVAHGFKLPLRKVCTATLSHPRVVALAHETRY